MKGVFCYSIITRSSRIKAADGDNALPSPLRKIISCIQKYVFFKKKPNQIAENEGKIGFPLAARANSFIRQTSAVKYLAKSAISHVKDIVNRSIQS